MQESIYEKESSGPLKNSQSPKSTRILTRSRIPNNNNTICCNYHIMFLPVLKSCAKEQCEKKTVKGPSFSSSVTLYQLPKI